MRIGTSRTLTALVLALVAVALGLAAPTSAQAGGACRGIPVTISAGDRVEMRQSCFFPTVLEISAGTTVTWINAEDAAHTVSGANLAWGDYATLNRGEAVSHTFATPGAYPYYCFLHPGMIGAVLVRAEGDEGSTTVAAETEGGGGLPGAGYGLLGALAGVLLTGTGIALVRRW
jgi:plastocyanin